MEGTGWAAAVGDGAAVAADAEEDSGSGSGSQSDEGMEDMLELPPGHGAAGSDGGPPGGYGALNFFLRRTSQLEEEGGGAPGGSHFSSMFKDLKSSDSTRQLMALTELSETLSFSTEEALLSFPMEMFIPVLVSLLESPGQSEESAGQVMLLCARCLHSVVDILPPTARIIIAAGGLPVLCSKLLNVEFIDVAEVAVAIIEWMSEDQPLQVLRAGCLQAALAFLDFFQMATQRQAANAASLMLAPTLPISALEQHVKPALPTLAALLQHSDPQVAQSICECWRRVLDSTIAAHHGEPQGAHGTSCWTSLDRLAASRRHLGPDGRSKKVSADFRAPEHGSSSSASGSGSAVTSPASLAAPGPLAALLEEMCPAGVLGSFLMLLGSGISAPSPHSTVVTTEVLYILAVLTNQSETITEELLNQDICALLQGLLTSADSGGSGQLNSRPPTGILPALAVIASMLPDIRITGSRCICEEKRLALFRNNPGYLQLLAESFLPGLLEIYEVSMEPIIQSLCVSLLLAFLMACREQPELVPSLLEPAGLSGFLANMLLASSSRTTTMACLAMAEELLQRHPQPYSVLFARHGVLHAIQKLSDGGRSSSRHHSAKEQLIQEASQRVLSARVQPAGAGSPGDAPLGEVAAQLRSDRQAVQPFHREALERLFGLLTSDYGVTTFELASSGLADALHAFLYPCAGDAGSSGWRDALTDRLQLFIDCVGRSPDGSLGTLVRLVVSAAQRVEQQPLTLFPIHAFLEAALPPHLRPHRAAPLGKGSGPPSGRGGVLEFASGFGRGGRGRDPSGGGSPLLSVLRLLAKPVKVRISPQGAPPAFGSAAVAPPLGAASTPGAADGVEGAPASPGAPTPSFRALLKPPGRADLGRARRLGEPPHAEPDFSAAAAAREGSTPVVAASPAARLRDYLASKVLPTAGRKRPALSAGAPSGISSSGASASERRSPMATLFSKAAAGAPRSAAEECLAGSSPGCGEEGRGPPGGAAGSAARASELLGRGRASRDRGQPEDGVEAVLLVEPFAMVGALEDYIWSKLGPGRDGARGPGAPPSPAAMPDSAAASASAAASSAPAGAASSPWDPAWAHHPIEGTDGGRSSDGGSAPGTPASFLQGAPPSATSPLAAGAEGGCMQVRDAQAQQPAGTEQRAQRVQLFLDGQPLSSKASLVQSLVQRAGRRPAPHSGSQRRPARSPPEGEARAERFLVSAEDSSGASEGEGAPPDGRGARASSSRGHVSGSIWGSVHSMTYEFVAPGACHRSPPGTSGPCPAGAGPVEPGRLAQEGPAFVPAELDALVRRHARAAAAIPALLATGSDAGEGQLAALLQLASALRHVCEHLGAEAVEDGSFHSNSLTSALLRQLSDPLAVCTGSVAPWCSRLAATCPFLFPGGARRILHNSCNLGPSRALHHVQQRALAQNAHSQEAQRQLEGEVAVASIPRQKVRISRQRMLESAVKVMNLYGAGTPLLEVEYVGEVGTGLGPTLEFYAQVAELLRTSEPRLFREGVPLGMVYPEPWRPEWLRDGQDKEAQQILERFRLLGHVVAKCILDSRLVDIQLHPLFWRLILGRGPLSQSSLREVDPALFSQMSGLQSMSATDIEGLCVDFTLPGHPQIELKTGGADIQLTADSVSEYVALVSEASLASACEPQVAAFRQAFAELLPLDACQIWSEKELSSIIMGASVSDDTFWTLDHLGAHIKAQHGYNAQSTCFRDLLAVMAAFEPEDRRKFLMFVSGTPALPSSGFAGLKPPLTVVKKEAPEAPRLPDEFMPSVMTCANYLKLPEYSSAEALEQKLQLAMNEGQSAFHLS